MQPRPAASDAHSLSAYSGAAPRLSRDTGVRGHLTNSLPQFARFPMSVTKCRKNLPASILKSLPLLIPCATVNKAFFHLTKSMFHAILARSHFFWNGKHRLSPSRKLECCCAREFSQSPWQLYQRKTRRPPTRPSYDNTPRIRPI